MAAKPEEHTEVKGVHGTGQSVVSVSGTRTGPNTTGREAQLCHCEREHREQEHISVLGT